MQSMDFVTQCAGVLFERAPALDDLVLALDGWAVAGSQPPASGEDGWLACGPGFVVELRSGGSVLVDVVDRPWPDEGGAASSASAFAAAWRSGVFGPVAAPGALARARTSSQAWAGGAQAVERHRAFVRLRTVVDLPADANASLPRDHDPVHELTAVTEMAGAILALRGATALFLPAGEALRSRDQVDEVMRRKTGVGAPPVELWVSLRALALGQIGDTRWTVVDTVGMGQLRVPDQEALFAEGQEQVEAVGSLLRNAGLHLVGGKSIPDGSTADDGQGRRWKAGGATSVLAPARPILRWLPEQSAGPNEAMLARLRALERPREP